MNKAIIMSASIIAGIAMCSVHDFIALKVHDHKVKENKEISKLMTVYGKEHQKEYEHNGEVDYDKLMSDALDWAKIQVKLNKKKGKAH